MKLIQRLVTSQVNAYVQAVNAEAYDYPAAIARECQTLADQLGVPVVLVDRMNDQHEFKPQESQMKPGDRVQLHPATDAWMRGDRFGTVVKVTVSKHHAIVHVKMDKSERVLKLAENNVDLLD